MTETRERVAGGEGVMSLTKAAVLLRMKRTNVAKFLHRRGIEPAFPKEQGYFYWTDDIMRAKEEREADTARMAADEKRRQSALRRQGVRNGPVPKSISRMGRTQREMLATLLVRTIVPSTDSERLALQRIAQRGLAERIEGGAYALTTAGREAAAAL